MSFHCKTTHNELTLDATYRDTGHKAGLKSSFYGPLIYPLEGWRDTQVKTHTGTQNYEQMQCKGQTERGEQSAGRTGRNWRLETFLVVKI